MFVGMVYDLVSACYTQDHYKNLFFKTGETPVLKDTGETPVLKNTGETSVLPGNAEFITSYRID